MTSGYFHKPEATAAISVAGRLPRQRRPRLSRGRRVLRHRPAEGPHHQGRAQPGPAGDRGDRLQRGGDPQGMRGRLRDRAGRRSAPRSWWSWPRRGPREPAARDALQAKVIERVAPGDRGAAGHRRAGRPGGRAQDVERQDPPRRHPRAVHRGRAGTERRHLVADPPAAWLAAAATARSSDRAAAAGRAAYAAYVGVLGVLIVAVFWPPVALRAAAVAGLRAGTDGGAMAVPPRRLPPARGGRREAAGGTVRPGLQPHLLRRRARAHGACCPQGFVFLAKKEIAGLAGHRLLHRRRAPPDRRPRGRRPQRGRRGQDRPRPRRRDLGADLPRRDVHRVARPAALPARRLPDRGGRRPAGGAHGAARRAARPARQDAHPAPRPHRPLGRRAAARERRRDGARWSTCGTAWPRPSPSTAASRGSTSSPAARRGRASVDRRAGGSASRTWSARPPSWAATSPPTPLRRSFALHPREAWLKLECWQPTGSFKVRGALHNLATLDAAARRRGVVAASAGNHALGVAFAGRRWAGWSATVYVPETAPRAKIDKLAHVRGHGGGRGPDLRRRARPGDGPRPAHGRDLRARLRRPAHGRRPGHGGAGDRGQLPAVGTVVVPVGGGGLITAMAVALKARLPGVRVVAVQPEASPSLRDSLAAGRALTDYDAGPTLADGLAGGIGTLVWEHRDLIDDVVTVSEAEIEAAIVALAAHDQVIAEGVGRHRRGRRRRRPHRGRRPPGGGRGHRRQPRRLRAGPPPPAP